MNILELQHTATVAPTHSVMCLMIVFIAGNELFPTISISPQSINKDWQLMLKGRKHKKKIWIFCSHLVGICFFFSQNDFLKHLLLLFLYIDTFLTPVIVFNCIWNKWWSENNWSFHWAGPHILGVKYWLKIDHSCIGNVYYQQGLDIVRFRNVEISILWLYTCT